MGLDLHLGTPSKTGEIARSLCISEDDGVVYAEIGGVLHALIPAPVASKPDPLHLLDIEDATYHDHDYVTDEPCHAQWSYGGFMRFRERIAQTIGITLDDMRGFSGDREWEDVKSDLVPLLNHSDCDDVLTPEQCAIVAPALRTAVEAMPEEEFDYDNSMGRQLADMMDRAAREGMTLLFG